MTVPLELIPMIFLHRFVIYYAGLRGKTHRISYLECENVFELEALFERCRKCYIFENWSRYLSVMMKVK